jgi:hypothetical protein
MNKIVSLISAIALVAATAVVAPVQAAAIHTASDQLSTIAQSTLANHTITFTTPTGVAGSETITATFPAGFNMGSVAFGDVDLTDDGTDLTLAATPSGTTWGAAVSGQVLTLTNGSTVVAAGSVMVIEIGTNAAFGGAGSNQITNPTAGTQVISLTAGSGADTGSIAVVTVATNTVSVTATVDPVITFALANGTDGNQAIAFGTLTSGTYAEDDVQLNYTSNATGGLTISMASIGLTTDVDGDGTKDNASDREIGVQSIASTTDTSATDYYKTSTAGGTGTVTFDDVDNAITNAAGRDMRATQDVVTATAPVSSTQLVTMGTKSAATTEAGSYSDTLTFTLTSTY